MGEVGLSDVQSCFQYLGQNPELMLFSEKYRFGDAKMFNEFVAIN